MKLLDYFDDILDAIKANKKVGKLPEGFDKNLKTAMENIDYINSCKRNLKKVGDITLSDIVIPGAMKIFVAPDSVTLTGSDDDADFKCAIPAENPSVIWDDTDWYKFTCAFNNVMGKTETITLDKAREKVSISSSNKYNFMNEDGMVPINYTKGIIPWPITLEVLSDDWYLETEEHAVKYAIAHFVD